MGFRGLGSRVLRVSRLGSARILDLSFRRRVEGSREDPPKSLLSARLRLNGLGFRA